MCALGVHVHVHVHVSTGARLVHISALRLNALTTLLLMTQACVSTCVSIMQTSSFTLLCNKSKTFHKESGAYLNKSSQRVKQGTSLVHTGAPCSPWLADDTGFWHKYA